VKVTNARGETVEARKVVLSVSTGVLQAEKIKFIPELPEWKQEAIRGLPMGLMNKIALTFKSDIFGGEESNYALSTSSVESGPDKNVLFLLKPQGHNAAVVFTGGDQAWRWEKKSDKECIEFAKDKLRECFGDAVDAELDQATVTRWGSNPFTLGAYSAASPGCTQQREELARPVDDKLFFCGEAATVPELNGSVAGAYQSGKRAAEEVLVSLAKEDAEKVAA
jgi:monoamine oxidase